MIARRPVRLATALVLVGGACASGGPQITLEDPITTPTVPTVSAIGVPPNNSFRRSSSMSPNAGEEISPLILGVSGEADAEYLRAAGITLLSWGGETATRYNYLIGTPRTVARTPTTRTNTIGSGGDAVTALLAVGIGRRRRQPGRRPDARVGRQERRARRPARSRSTAVGAGTPTTRAV